MQNRVNWLGTTVVSIGKCWIYVGMAVSMPLFKAFGYPTPTPVPPRWRLAILGPARGLPDLSVGRLTRA